MSSMTLAEYLALHKRKKEPPSEMSSDVYVKKYVPKHTSLTEHGIQVALVDWFRETYPDYLIFAIPNGAKLPYTQKRNKVTGKMMTISPLRQKLLEEGMVAGIPDLCIPIARGKYHGLYVELKTAEGEVSDNQQTIHRTLRIFGYCVEVPFGLEPAKKAITDYLNLPPADETEKN